MQFRSQRSKVNEHLPSSNEGYGRLEYWDRRYQNEESFDWFVDYSKIRDLVLKYVRPHDAILNLGCGNSSMPVEMWLDRFRNITNIDYSSVVIETMAARTRDMPGLGWRVADIFKLSEEFSPERFEVIVEKGTLDALLVSEKDPWNYSEEAELMLDGILKQVSSILKPGGRFISVTFCQPHFRLPFYAKPEYNWSVAVETVGSSFHYFYYVLTKGEPLSPQYESHRIKYQLRKEERNKCEIEDENISSSNEDEDYLLRVESFQE